MKQLKGCNTIETRQRVCYVLHPCKSPLLAQHVSLAHGNRINFFNFNSYPFSSILFLSFYSSIIKLPHVPPAWVLRIDWQFFFSFCNCLTQFWVIRTILPYSLYIKCVLFLALLFLFSWFSGYVGERELRSLSEKRSGGGPEPPSPNSSGPQDLWVLQCPHCQVLVPYGERYSPTVLQSWYFHCILLQARVLKSHNTGLFSVIPVYRCF